MKSIATIVCIICFALCVASCSQRTTLTDGSAQNAINQWLSNNGIKVVMGVVENPADNTAKVSLKLTNFLWNAPKNDLFTAFAMGPGGGVRTFNGDATATFVHYTDGRWVLMRVDTPIGFFDNINIVAN